jgi:hypothetical protein
MIMHSQMLIARESALAIMAKVLSYLSFRVKAGGVATPPPAPGC